MHITKKKFEALCKKYSNLLIIDGDAAEALAFARELLEAEADGVKEKEPYATNSIARLNSAAYEIFNICNAIENEEFEED